MADGCDANYGTDAEAGLQVLDGLSLQDTDSTLNDEGPQDDTRYETSSDEDNGADDFGAIRTPEAPFDPRRCLFCKSYAIGFDESLEHMTKKHSFFIPNRDQLIIEPEILIEYFYLVIFGYFECLYCGSPRQSVQAVQQHMVGKGHCKIDIEKEDSEYQEFYQCHGTARSNEAQPLMATTLDDEDKSIRLPSGKVLSHRTQERPRIPRQRTLQTPNQPDWSTSQQPSTSASPEPVNPSTSKRLAKREAVFQTQLASLRGADRMSLMHLPTWKQRKLVLESKRQVERARREENEMLLKIQLQANKTLKD